MDRAAVAPSGAAMLAFVAIVLAIATSCAVDPPWQSRVLRAHPLVGRIWHPASARFVEPDEVVGALEVAPFALLGEKHDNPDHHRIQAWLLEQLVRRGRRPSVVWEMFTTDHDERIAAFLASAPRDAAGLGPAVDWEATGWPDWTTYQPIADVAVEAGLPLLSGSLPGKWLRTLMQQGPEALEPDAVGTPSLGVLESLESLEPPMPEAQRDAIRVEVVEVHCRMLPESLVDAMVEVTLVKDAFLAQRLREGAARPGADGAVLIAGSGHVRSDRGVPWHLARQAPGQDLVAVAVREVVEGRDDPAAYAAEEGDETLPFDYVWFTPRVDSEDPCAVHAERLREAGRGHLEDSEAGKDREDSEAGKDREDSEAAP